MNSTSSSSKIRNSEEEVGLTERSWLGKEEAVIEGSTLMTIEPPRMMLMTRELEAIPTSEAAEIFARECIDTAEEAEVMSIEDV